MRLSFHLPPLRHLPPLCCGRSRSQLLLYIVPVLPSELSHEPLGGCRCALCRGNIRSVVFLRSAALTLRSLLQIPASSLSAQGITARLAAFFILLLSALIGAQYARHASLSLAPQAL